MWNNEKLKLDGALEDTRSITKQSTEYAQKLETSMTKMNELLIQLTASEEQRNTEIRLLKEDLEAVKNLVPSVYILLTIS